MKKVMNAIAIADRTSLTNEEWLRIRKRGIGGSDAGAMLGYNKYVSPYQLFIDKTTDAIDDFDNEAIRQGRDLEAYVARRFVELMANEGHPVSVKKCNFVLQHPEHSIMLADVDRLIVGEKAGLECKTTTLLNKTDFEADDIPPAWLAQCTHYMAVTGAERWYLCVLVLGRKCYKFCLNRHEGDIAALIEAETYFWNENVLKGIAPSPTGTKNDSELILSQYPVADEGAEIDLMPYAAELKQLSDIKEKKKELEAQEGKLTQEIQLYMKDAAFGRTGDYTVSWKTRVTSRLDSTRLKKENPDMYKQYVNETISRTFLLKKAN